ncbi:MULTISPECIES: NYN domain-containing protein [unclassified Neisseria]|uniref:NYN domain-containing protein n=1 Tax=unclassified Neisseria TaxID=2623750 RepID=UPI001072C029|nr:MULTISPECIES: NYN domain-containing protein [unclassified Neisseria]MBF0802767.1 NYN domain-containing protein [Neisseria sp. 19428wB4_WF04]TFU44566.1 NYN domain-containing protein [Neisseria sp. WF04]
MNIADKKLAVLIDADNAPADIIDRLLEEIAKYGIASVKRIYGDWSHGLNKWKAALLPHAIIPVQQFAYTKGKNATDMALVIDAMDLLYSGNFDGFCIVSSDSDFTRLASRLRESGLTVYGFGEKKTPEAFRKACDKFIHTEIFRPEKNGADKNKSSGKAKPAAEAGPSAPDAATLIKRAVRENADDLGWANLGPIGSYLNKINPDFDPRLYGFSKLSELIKSFDIFEWRTDNNQIQVRRRTVAEKNGRPSENGQHEPRPGETGETARGNKAAQPGNAPAEAAKPDTPPAPGRKPARKARVPQTGVPSKTMPSETPPEEPAAAENAAKPKSSGKPTFTKLIPVVQQAVDAAADEGGWARLGDVLKQLAPAVNPHQYGFDTDRALIHAIYSDWLEIKKAGRGERVRVNKRFVSKD